MPLRRDTHRTSGRKRSVQAMEAAEDVLPAVVRSCLRAGLTPDALRAVFERVLGDWREPCAPSSDSGDDRQDLDDLARVLSIWHTDPRFVDREGEPRKIRQSGRAPSFEALALIAIPSVPAQEALKRLLIVVEIDSRDRVRALRRELVTSSVSGTGSRPPADTWKRSSSA